MTKDYSSGRSKEELYADASSTPNFQNLLVVNYEIYHRHLNVALFVTLLVKKLLHHSGATFLRKSF